MNFLRSGVSVLLMVVLAGCATTVPLQRDQIGTIVRETAPDDLEKILGKATPTAQFEFAANGAQFFARQYNLLTGSRPETMVICTPTCIPISTTVPVFTPYVVVQNLPSRSIHAWGTIEELSKDADVNVSSIMPALKVRLAEAQKAK